jgi:Flp pilus assembly protein TadD
VFFSRTRALGLPLLILAAVLGVACARRPQPEIQRLAILRFENMTPGPATDWIGRGLSEIITTELAGSPGIYAIPASRLHLLNPAMAARPIAAPGISAEAQLAHAAGATRIGYGEYATVGERLHVRLTIEDPRTRQMAQAPIEATVNAGDMVGAATALARQISAGARPFPASNGTAIEAYIRGLESGDQASVRQYAEQSIAADPNFGPGYIMLAETALKQQDRPGAMAAIAAAASRGSAISELSRARLEALAATLRGDGAGLERALGAAAQASPLDPLAWRSLADASAGRRQYAQAATAYERALAIEPEDAITWNQLGYIQAYAGNIDAAMTALRRYQALRPADPNPIDSMGDVSVLAGRLKEAEEFYLEAHKKNPAFLNGMELFKAAMARLMTGDVAGASAILADKANTADWIWLAGRRKEAYARLAAEAPPPGSPKSAQLAIWALLLNDRPVAARLGAQTPAGSPIHFLTQPPAPAASWIAQAAQLPDPLRDSALAYALLLDRHFEEAIPVLRRLEARAGNAGDRGPAIELAWALIETGKFQEAEPLLRMDPVPGVDNATAFIGLYFPRLFQLRALVAEHEGKADDARENRRIYAALGGE